MAKKNDKKKSKQKDGAAPVLEMADAGAAAAVESPAEPKKMSTKEYEAELENLQTELVRLQEWIKVKGLKVMVVFEGRDTAGKGGVIKRITERTSPRVIRVVALSTPTDREKSQYYLQRYIPHLPAAGEMVLFDRSWYNRLGVEKVMGFCTEEQYQSFLVIAPGFERTLADSGIILIKYWLEITQEVQEKRFQERLTDPRKYWKLSPMDHKARSLWDNYTKARDVMFEHTATDVAPWYVVDSNSQRMGRLNCIKHLLSVIPYEDLLTGHDTLPKRKWGKNVPAPDLPNVVSVPLVYP